MKQNFITRFYDAASSVAGSASGFSPVGAGIAGVQGALGIIQSISADAKLKKLMARRTAYKTPEEYFTILQATQNAAQQGYDPFTLNYLTNQTDRAFDQASGAATRLGANPNDLGALFDQKMQGIMKIGAENHALNLASFSKYLSAVDVIGQNKAAEQVSADNLIKDQMQAAAADKAAGVQNVGSAANAFISMSSAAKTSDLYKQIQDALSALKKQGGAVGLPAASGMGPGRTPSEILANSNIIY